MIHVKDLVADLTEHPLYRSIGDDAALRLFMCSHVFCVWDFMSLLKALQRGLTCIETPWHPQGDREARRFINEIVVAEESDVHPAGGYISHFELYREAMYDGGADEAPIESFFAKLHSGDSVNTALACTSLPPGVQDFVTTTFGFLENDSLHCIAAAFAYGREDVIPDMFRRLVRQLAQHSPQHWGKFLYYLERHIEVDGDQHGPLAHRLVARLCGNDGQRWHEANLTARRALEARIRLWDAILADIRSQERHPSRAMT
ncbi:MAG: DUF3050 domain-containing protein [Sulfuricaulis sp.]